MLELYGIGEAKGFSALLITASRARCRWDYQDSALPAARSEKPTVSPFSREQKCLGFRRTRGFKKVFNPIRTLGPLTATDEPKCVWRISFENYKAKRKRLEACDKVHIIFSFLSFASGQQVFLMHDTCMYMKSLVLMFFCVLFCKLAEFYGLNQNILTS